MDKKAKGSWAWMAEQMPGVVAKIKERRSAGQGAHLDLCWRRGVVALEPGWFYAYENGVSVGVPDPAMLADEALQLLLQNFPSMHVLMLKEPVHAKA